MVTRSVPRPARLILLPLLVGLALALTACGPEGGRERGGGAGADNGNRDDTLQLTGNEERDERIYRDTPGDGPVTEG